MVLRPKKHQTWFTEYQTDSLSLGLRIDQVLMSESTEFQDMLVAETATYGRLLALDGAVQTTDRDEFVYHEMITHVPLYMRPAPKKVAVIGGGDGGAIREILKHPSVEEARLVEIDGRVIAAARRYFPDISVALDNPRAHIEVTDGIEWVKTARGYDVIIVDSTDPVGPAEGLFQAEFYQSIARALTDDGILVAQSESPFLHQALIRQMVQGMRTAFPLIKLYWAAIPTYPTGMWSFLMASHQPLTPAQRCEASTIETRYWTPEMQRACFVLPRFAQELLL